MLYQDDPAEQAQVSQARVSRPSKWPQQVQDTAVDLEPQFYRAHLCTGMFLPSFSLESGADHADMQPFAFHLSTRFFYGQAHLKNCMDSREENEEDEEAAEQDNQPAVHNELDCISWVADLHSVARHDWAHISQMQNEQSKAGSPQGEQYEVADNHAHSPQGEQVDIPVPGVCRL